MTEKPGVVDFQKLLNKKFIGLEVLEKLQGAGFKLVALGPDGMPAVKWTEVYDNGSSMEYVRKNRNKFYGVGTCFGFNPAKNLYLNCLDIDSEVVFYA